jgi:phosphate:Na+ symporter
VLLLVPRRAGLAPWGWIFLGAGLGLVGWVLLEDAVDLASLSRKLKTDVLFGDVDYSLSFTIYASRFVAYSAVGAMAAFLLRTSNLVVVVAILLASRGIFDAGTAVPLVLGANVGSAGMVFVLSLRKRREARRLALANLVTHFLGSVCVLALSLVSARGHSLFVWLIEWIVPGRLHSPIPSNIEAHLAATHTVYNFLAGVPFLIHPGALLRIVDHILPPKPVAQDVKPYLLDRNLIAVPALALRQATEEVIYLTEVCQKTIAESFDSFRYNDLDLSEQVVRREEVIAEMHRSVSQYLVEVCENQLSRRDASHLEILQTAASSLLRIGELAERLRDVTARKIEERVASNAEVDRDMNEVYDLAMAQFGNILSLLRQRDAKTEENAVKMIERLAKYSSRIESPWRQRLADPGQPQDPAAVHDQVVVYQEAFQILFSVSGHLAHIAHTMRLLAPDRF